MAKKLEKITALPEEEKDNGIDFSVLVYKMKDGSVTFAESVRVDDVQYSLDDISIEGVSIILSQAQFTLAKAYVDVMLAGKVTKKNGV